MHSVDYSEIEDNPFGKVFFDFGSRLFQWDADYAKEVEKNLKKIKRREASSEKILNMWSVFSLMPRNALINTKKI